MSSALRLSAHPKLLRVAEALDPGGLHAQVDAERLRYEGVCHGDARNDVCPGLLQVGNHRPFGERWDVLLLSSRREGAHEAEEHDGEVEHIAFHAEYELTCSDAGKLTSLEATVFDQFPDLEEMEVEVVTPSGQKGSHVEPGETSLEL